MRSARTTWARLFAVAYDADPYRNFVDAVGPDSEVASRLRLVAARPFTTEPQWVAAEVGSGALISAPDTVAYAVWCAARHLDDLVEALWATASAGGDIDTACAMVGGIVAARTGLHGVPAQWREATEPLPSWAAQEPARMALVAATCDRPEGGWPARTIAEYPGGGRRS